MSDVTITTYEGSVASDLVASVVNVSNFEGRTGATGPAGDPGPGITAGSGAPSGSSAVGELYIDTATGNLYRFS